MGSTSSPVVSKYDVFISFRGPDARDKFVCYLSNALKQKNIIAYTDYRIEVGEGISTALRQAIEESTLAIVVFSEDYASSWWCLDELQHIQKCKRNLHIIPVFYGIDPSYVRKLKGKYQEAFTMHQSERPADTVKEMREAVKNAANTSGIDSKLYRPETKLVAKIVEVVGEKLRKISCLTDNPINPVGIGKHMTNLEPLLDIGSPRFRIIGISGMIGVGKTTVATFLYERIRSEFDNYHIVKKVTRTAKTQGLNNEQESLRDLLFGIRNSNDSVNKVLIVLDDVDDEDQYYQLLPRGQIQFHPESRIIVTTTNGQLLKNIGAEEYKVEPLNDCEGRELFNSIAFDKSSNCMSEFADLYDKVVKHHSGGVPKAIEILGKRLQGASREEWKGELQEWESVLHWEILKEMRSCYENLDRRNKDIFLDIACFFKGEDKNFVERILHGCNFYPKSRIKDLHAHSLITITRDNKIAMHSLLQRVAQEIVLEQSGKVPANRSRLWIAEDICDILEKDIGAPKLEGIFLDMSNCTRMVRVIPTAFSNMRSLRLLKIHNSRSVEECNVCLPQCLQSLPNSLVYFHWHSYRQKSLPPDFAPNGLVELNMPYSRLEYLWPTGAKHLGNLQRIDLSYSEQLTKIPDFSQARNMLESLNLEGCSGLKKLPSDISNLVKLTSLNLKGCSSLQTLPSNIYDLQNLGHLDLSGCCQLENFPQILRPMGGLKKLILDKTSIKELPSTIKNLSELKLLSLNMCKNLRVLPSSISCMQSLERLNLCHCSNLKSLPNLPPSLPWVDARYCTALETVSISKASPGQALNIFVFYNCLKLDQNSHNNIMADAQLRILQKAKATKEAGENKATDGDEICFPGDEIPEWFTYKNQGDVINVELDHQADWSNSNFLGFAFCVVVSFRDVSSDTDFQLHCQSECISSDGKRSPWSRTWTWHWNYLDEKSTINSRHIFVFCDTCPRSHGNLPPKCEASSSKNTPMSAYYYNNSSATFSFRPTDFMGHVTSWNSEVQWCGVHLLYTHDLDKFHINNHVPDVGDSPLETVDPATPRVERGYIIHATNDWQRRLISCLCSSCCFRLREIIGRRLEYSSQSVNGSVRPDVDQAMAVQIEILKTKFRNLELQVERLEMERNRKVENRQILEECVDGRQVMRQYEMNVQVQPVR